MKEEVESLGGGNCGFHCLGSNVGLESLISLCNKEEVECGSVFHFFAMWYLREGRLACGDQCLWPH